MSYVESVVINDIGLNAYILLYCFYVEKMFNINLNWFVV